MLELLKSHLECWDFVRLFIRNKFVARFVRSHLGGLWVISNQLE
jgi:ABC-type polysaccharide/polyol phosphate export permease